MLRRPSERSILAAYAAYFFVTGAWPLAHYRSFEEVSGRKTDDWLVKTLGALLLPVALALALFARRGSTVEARALAAGSSLALGAADVWYVARSRISPVYLADAAVEATLLAALLACQREPEETREAARYA